MSVGHAGGVVVAEELDVAAERNGRELPAGAVAVVETDNLGPETERKRQHFDAAPARDQKMAKLVKKHDNREHEKKRDNIAEQTAAECAQAVQNMHPLTLVPAVSRR